MTSHLERKNLLSSSSFFFVFAEINEVAVFGFWIVLSHFISFLFRHNIVLRRFPSILFCWFFNFMNCSQSFWATVPRKARNLSPKFDFLERLDSCLLPRDSGNVFSLFWRTIVLIARKFRSICQGISKQRIVLFTLNAWNWQRKTAGWQKPNFVCLFWM